DELINDCEGKKHGIQNRDAGVVYNKYGAFTGRALCAPVKKGNISVHCPEGNAIIPQGDDEAHAGLPEYNAAVIVEKAETFYAQKDKRYVEKRVQELETEMS